VDDSCLLAIRSAVALSVVLVHFVRRWPVWSNQLTYQYPCRLLLPPRLKTVAIGCLPFVAGRCGPLLWSGLSILCVIARASKTSHHDCSADCPKGPLEDGKSLFTGTGRAASRGWVSVRRAGVNSAAVCIALAPLSCVRLPIDGDIGLDGLRFSAAILCDYSRCQGLGTGGRSGRLSICDAVRKHASHPLLAFARGDSGR